MRGPICLLFSRNCSALLFLAPVANPTNAQRSRAEPKLRAASCPALRGAANRGPGLLSLGAFG